MPDAFSATAARLHREIGAILAAPVLSSKNSPLGPLRASIEVQAQAALLVTAAVERAREAGCTWQDVGDVLGVSRQAAFQRFGKPIDPRTGEAMNTAPLPEAVTLAETVIDALSRGAWGEVTDRFDAKMRGGLTGEGLATAWAQVIGMAGAYEHRGKTEAARAADITITNTPLVFEAGNFTARISFRDDHTIAGLYILPRGES
ncbi:MAG: DUF3887 domain-containing protein [Microbacteriaceae bacterium]